MARVHADAELPADPTERLASLAARTERIAPPSDFTDRVMDLVIDRGPASRRTLSKAPMSRRTAFADGVSRTGIRAMALAAAVAAICVIYSAYAEQALNTRIVSTIDTSEGAD